MVGRGWAPIHEYCFTHFCQRRLRAADMSSSYLQDHIGLPYEGHTTENSGPALSGGSMGEVTGSLYSEMLLKTHFPGSTCQSVQKTHIVNRYRWGHYFHSIG